MTDPTPHTDGQVTRCDQYRDLLERWSAWWNGPGREQFQGLVLPPLTDTAAALTCTICVGLSGEDRCAACGRALYGQQENA